MRNYLLSLTILFTSLISIVYAGSILNVQQWQANSGTKIYFVNAPQIPMVDVLIAFKAGSDRDGIHYGLANLTSEMLGETTTQLNANEIADKIDGLGMKFDSKTNKDMTVIHMRSLTDTKYLKPSLNLLITLLSKATFPKKVFVRIQNNTLQVIAQSEQNPAEIAGRNFSELIFKNSPYAHASLGDMDTVSKITPAEINNFYKKYYVAQNALIVIVGDLTGFQAKAMGAEIADALLKGKAAPNLAMVNNNTSASKHVNFPADQTAIRIGEVGIPYKDAQDHALIVGNYILGSGMTSRLFQTVREKYGLTYGIGSYFIPLANRGAFIVGLQTKTSQVDQAIKVTKDVIENYLKTGPTQQELQAAKDYLIGSFPLKIESNSDIAEYVLTSAFYQLPFDYLDSYKKDIKAVTALQAKAAMNQYIHPKDFVIVTVGQSNAKKHA